MTAATPTRADHLAWCKARALEYLDRGDISQAVASMLSDLRKHPETDGHQRASRGYVAVYLASCDERSVRHWIEGFH